MAQTLAQFAEPSPDPAYEWRVRVDAIHPGWRNFGHARMKTLPELRVLLQDAMDAASIDDTVEGTPEIQNDYLYFSTAGFDTPHDLVPTQAFGSGFSPGFE